MAPPDEKPKVIGICGVSGSGKTYLLQKLHQIFQSTRTTFFEGSEHLATFVNGGLTKFNTLDAGTKEAAREEAIWAIRDHCAAKNVLVL